MNILWLTVDSMRSYSGSSDDRGKIPFFDEFCKDAIEFTNCFCSAPSTVMSVSSMMTAVPAVYHSTAYDHFDKNSFGFETFPDWLEKKGFKTNSILFFPEGREHLTHLMGDTLRRYWPKNKNNLFWNNKNIYDVFVSALDECKENDNNFFYVHFNIRHDPNTNEWVKKCYFDFQRSFKDAIIVLTSDHGYPDPDQGVEKKDMIYHGHDLLMTDDNVRVPLAINGISSANSSKLNNKLVSLVDIVPTLQKIIDPNLEVTLNGNFFDSGNDIFSNNRSDLQIYNRYIFQKNQQIKFVFNNNKVIYSKNNYLKEEFGKLVKYKPNIIELKIINEKIKNIHSHFKIFLKKKVNKLNRNSYIYSSNPPPNFSIIINSIRPNDIEFTDNLSDLSKKRNVYILKPTENIFKVIADLKAVKKYQKKYIEIKVLSLNLDEIKIPKNAVSATVALFCNKLVPRFLSNPAHTLVELWVVFMKVIKS